MLKIFHIYAYSNKNKMTYLYLYLIIMYLTIYLFYVKNKELFNIPLKLEVEKMETLLFLSALEKSNKEKKSPEKYLEEINNIGVANVKEKNNK